MLGARPGVVYWCTEPSPEHTNQHFAVFNAETFINQTLRPSNVQAWVSIRFPPPQFEERRKIGVSEHLVDGVYDRPRFAAFGFNIGRRRQYNPKDAFGSHI